MKLLPPKAKSLHRDDPPTFAVRDGVVILLDQPETRYAPPPGVAYELAYGGE